MIRRKALAVTCVVVGLAASVLIASNMMFKLNRSFEGPQPNPALPLGVTTGTNSLALPFNQQPDLIDAEDLLADIDSDTNGAADLIMKFVRSADALLFYNGSTGVNFALTPGEGYLVQVNTDADYLIVGSHDPALSIVLLGPQPNPSPSGESSGTNLYAYPFHSVASNAEELMNEIGSSTVVSVGRWVNSIDGIEIYTGFAGQTNFALVPGEAYYVVVNTDVSFVPAHY